MAFIYCNRSATVVPAGRTTDILGVRGEAMIDACGQHDQVILFQPDAYPIVPFVSHVEEAVAVEDVSDLLVFVKMLVEEHPHFVFVDIAHLLRRDGNFISVLVAAVSGNRVDLVYRRTAVVEYTEVTQVVAIDKSPRIVVVALVTLKRFSVGSAVATSGAALDLLQAGCQTNTPSFFGGL